MFCIILITTKNPKFILNVFLRSKKRKTRVLNSNKKNLKLICKLYKHDLRFRLKIIIEKNRVFQIQDCQKREKNSKGSIDSSFTDLLDKSKVENPSPKKKNSKLIFIVQELNLTFPSKKQKESIQ
jgi:hypothetical protein